LHFHRLGHRKKQCGYPVRCP